MESHNQPHKTGILNDSTREKSQLDSDTDGNKWNKGASSVDHKSDVESTSTAEDPLLGTQAEKKLIRKLDFTLLPLFTLICNARIAGLEKDLGMKGLDFNKSLTVFYVFYILVEVPSNLALKRFGSIWIALLVLSFGVIALGTAFVKSYAGLVVTRVFLGLAEGGTLSGLVYCLSRYYRRHELVWRIGIFFGLSPSLAGAFGGLLASGLLKVDDIGSLTRWRKIFFIEGIITMAIGVFLLFFMPGDPTTTKLLNEEERAIAIARLDADRAVKTNGKMERTTAKLIWRSLNFNTMLCSTAYMMINISFQGLSSFLPTVINSLGHFTTVEAQLRTVPPYLVGAVWALICAYMSFHFNQRCIPIILSVILMVIGYSLAVGTVNVHARYAACFFGVAGGGPSGPLYLTWGTDNAAPETMRAVATALIPGLGQIGAIIAVWTYLPSDAPNFHKGNSLNLATSCAVCLITALGGLYIRWENGKRDRGERDGRLCAELSWNVRADPSTPSQVSHAATEAMFTQTTIRSARAIHFSRLLPCPSTQRYLLITQKWSVPPKATQSLLFSPARSFFTSSWRKAEQTPPPPILQPEESNSPKETKPSIRENIYTIPNLLTVSRILSCPVLGWSILDGNYYLASGLLVYAGLTDLVDGYLARRYNMSSVLGTILDPAADKILMTTLTVTLTMQNLIPIPIAVIILGRDVLLSLSAFWIRYSSLPHPKTWSRYWDFSLPSAEVRPTMISKVNTALQLLLMGTTTISPILPVDIHVGLQGLQWIVATTTIWSGLSYVFTKDAVRIVSQSRKLKP
ncbi:hypothetical protein CVT24_005817 [Panaeolus cyanescens]|uniref:Major facilitator superfamily (MFS) profile domain-containing protein n=1 Tax=Panaeolus cyanescens TaxID=181874 RepID=A0A409V906_9AGAR|nr:hypothetical protein CVT24_005817 [Panaeolus cyanescens]